MGSLTCKILPHLYVIFFKILVTLYMQLAYVGCLFYTTEIASLYACPIIT